VTPTSGLTHEEIDKLVLAGEKFKSTDELRRDFAEMKNQAETLIYTTEQALEGYADLLDGDKLDMVRAELDGLKTALEAGVDLAGLRDAYMRLENATFEIAEAMYGGADG
jgi:molecular chaperone DnaK